MSEAEVILRLAIYYVKNHLTNDDVIVSIDGAHVKTGNTVHFNVFSCLNKEDFFKIDGNSKKWQGEYAAYGYNGHIIVSSIPGIGDVTVKLKDGRTVFAECKKGKCNMRSREYPLMREAIGQIVTSDNLSDNMIPIVAVPYTEKAEILAKRWSALKTIKYLGIKFALICDDGSVNFY